MKLAPVKGGAFLNQKSAYYGTDAEVGDFLIGKFEVTQAEWTRVMGSNPSYREGEDLPVERVSWYDAVEFCNRLSEREGLKRKYVIDRGTVDPRITSEDDDIRWTVTMDPSADGYRLPTEAEWEYAASGGQKTKGYAYSGSDAVDDVGYYWQNSGKKRLEGYWNWGAIQGNDCGTHRVGKLKPNELGLYDMSGNVREWCWDWIDASGPDSSEGRALRGGGWAGGGEYCGIIERDVSRANRASPDLGFRVCRDAPPR